MLTPAVPFKNAGHSAPRTPHALCKCTRQNPLKNLRGVLRGAKRGWCLKPRPRHTGLKKLFNYGTASVLLQFVVALAIKCRCVEKRNWFLYVRVDYYLLRDNCWTASIKEKITGPRFRKTGHQIYLYISSPISLRYAMNHYPFL